ncbi:MAG: DUF1553 domain-containing protein [Planctomycetaceae bacterium]
MSGWAADATGSTESTISFEESIAPLLQQHCIRCHQPGNEKGDISLHAADDLRELDYLSPRRPEESDLLELVTATESDPPQMPKESPPLSAAEVDLLRQWIIQGADWPADVVVRQASKADQSWWSLQPLQLVDPPASEGLPSGWERSPIDRFVFAKLTENGLTPNPPADRRTLLRRVTYDLTGLPPTPEATASFLADDSPEAYSRLVDRLLDSPHYGERWGRHWLDVVRFGESRGYERNQIISDLWPFRDYVIRSLNEDKPFDQFIREHLAGDVVGANQPAIEIGAAFLVAGPYDDVGNQDPVQAAQIRANTLDEIIQATGDAFLGMTIGCARCHDHKFDPIRQEDYYKLYATFAGVEHGSRIVATEADRAAHAARLKPLDDRRKELTRERKELEKRLQQRAEQQADEIAQTWTRPPVDRQGTAEPFPPQQVRFVRLVSEGQDANPSVTNAFNLDELEVWSAGQEPRNVALASNGGRAFGPSRVAEDTAVAYRPENANDGKLGARFVATGGQLTIELAEPTLVDRVVFYSAKGQTNPEHKLFLFPGEYRIEVSQNGEQWTEAANSHDRQPVNAAWRQKRLLDAVTTPDEQHHLQRIREELERNQAEIAAVPALPSWWVGKRSSGKAQGPFHVFIGGSPQRPGENVTAGSPSFVPAALTRVSSSRAPTPYSLPADAPEGERRLQLAEWITSPENPLTPRVLANRVWHYHFGTGIVDTPSDFGYMGGRPTHPELLDWLAARLLHHSWRLKPLHRDIVLSQAYQQSSTARVEASQLDGDARLLWRFPPRRLSAEEVRDTLLSVAGQLQPDSGGPGFKLYHYMQDNVATYIPLDDPGPETFRRGVYHHNARAARTDLMTDFDQPDCAFSAPRRAETTTPLQALTLLNHAFTLRIAKTLAERVKREAGGLPADQIQRAYRLCFQRSATNAELAACEPLCDRYGLAAFCRVLLNTSELIYVE